MNAVFRLILIVSCVYLLALLVTLYEMLQQANKDLTREINSSVSYTHQLMSLAVDRPRVLDSLLNGDLRHVDLRILESSELVKDISGEIPLTPIRDGEAPHWFFELIPNISELEDKSYVRYLKDGRALRLQPNTSDEVDEVWESVQQVLLIFVLSAVLSNLAIYLGIRQGIKPFAQFLAALQAMQKGTYTSRLGKFSVREINELSDHFNKMAEAVERSEQTNRELVQQMMELQEKERAYLARELHDDLGQYLTGIQAQAFLVQSMADNPQLAERAGKQIGEHCEAMQGSFRRLVRDLHPVILEQLGLSQAIEDLVNKFRQTQGLTIHLELPEQLPTMSDEWHNHIYRIVQEALNNIARHASATEAKVSFRLDCGQLQLSIQDNGQGLAPDLISGLGMRSMQERASCMQGEFTAFNQQQGGAAVRIKLPVKEEVNEDSYSG